MWTTMLASNGNNLCLSTIWLTRNSNAFEKRKNHINVHQTVAKAVEYHHVPAILRPARATTTLYLKWRPPDKGYYKLNNDRTACLDTRKGGIGGYSETAGSGLKIALDQGLSLLVIDSDSEMVLEMLKNGNLTHNPIISECRYLMKQLGNPVTGHSYREQNQVADLLAKEGARKEVFGKTQFLAIPPVFANEAVLADILGTVFDRKINVCNRETLIDTDDNQHGISSPFIDVIL
ncbi:hypothetical protein A4A49_54534 [Nicotiana attenuata]|uniref:RNase H type-1 domain-containing protein n=1 Tax=Nicotiana attenuata TaxID=49451 RepID=A0A1J6JTU4_NICAT|nr:hypothetical protein A4A49_54534 [Nicotiana attenuata]